MGVTGRADGELLPDVVYHYRDHAGQMTEQAGYRDQDEYDARWFAYTHGELLHRAANGTGRAAHSGESWTAAERAAGDRARQDRRPAAGLRPAVAPA